MKSTLSLTKTISRLTPSLYLLFLITMVILFSARITINENKDIIKTIAEGYRHTVLLTYGGKAYIYTASLINDDEKDCVIEVELSQRIIAATAGGNQFIFLTSKGEVWEYRAKGVNFEKYDSFSLNKIAIKDVISISCGDEHAIALKKDGTVWGWGNNYMNQISNSIESNIIKPLRIDLLKSIISIDSNGNNNLAIDSKGVAWAWGANDCGQLGIGSFFNCNVPDKVLLKESVIQVSCGRNHSMALDSEGNVWVWGSNGNGQIPNEICMSSNIPIKIKNVNDIKDIQGSDDSCIVLDKYGYVWVWGGRVMDNNGTILQEASSDVVKLNLYKDVNYISGNYKKNNIFTSDISWLEYINKMEYSKMIIPQKMNGDEKRLIVAIIDSNNNVEKSINEYCFINTKEIPNNFVDDDNNGYIDDTKGWDFSESNGELNEFNSNNRHGTTISYIIAKTLRSNGITNSEVVILPIKYTSNEYGNEYDIVQAIKYAESMGADLVNCSFGSSQFSPEMFKIMEGSKAIYVCAAGNDGRNIEQNEVYPACFNLENIVCVAASDEKGNLLENSNYGAPIDVIKNGIVESDFFEKGCQIKQYGTSIATAFTTVEMAIEIIKGYDER